MAHEAPQPVGQVVKMILALREEYGRSAFLQDRENVIDDALIACVIARQCSIKILNTVTG